MLEETEVTTLYGHHVAKIRATELPDLVGQIYLDSSGQPAVPRSLLNAVHHRLCNGSMISNPHSSSPSGLKTKEELDEVRSIVCQEIFNVARRGGRMEEQTEVNTLENGYELVFTSGATASLKDVAQSFDFNGEGRFAYLQQSHSSLIGLRDVVLKQIREKGAKGCDVLREDEIIKWVKRQSKSGGTSLLALPLQCNATGKRYNKLVATIIKARQQLENSTSQRKIYILLDAASYLSPSSNLPLKSDSSHQPDFICFSFLKILGYPSGLGGLLISRGSASLLLSGKQYYGGGTLEAITSRQHWRKPAREIKDALEDGTQNLFGIIAVKSALKVLRSDSLLNSWNQASDYVDNLTQHLWNSLNCLYHQNSSPVVQIYSSKPESWPDNNDMNEDSFHLPTQSQGPIVLFNILRPAASRHEVNQGKTLLIDPSEVDRLACVENIHIRSGRMCNVGAITKALDLEEEDIQILWERGIGCGSVVASSCQSKNESHDDEKEEERRLQGLVSGCLRVSLSAWNTVEDIDQLILFIKKYFVEEGNGVAFQSCDEVCLSEGSCEDSEIEIDQHTSSQGTSDTSHSSMQELQSTSEHYLQDLHLYPIKSCACQTLSSEEKWKLTPTGLQYDRQFCIIDEGNGKVLSQKQIPKMARIRPKINLVTQMLEVLLIGEEEEEVEAFFSISLIDSDMDHKKQQQRGYDMCGKVLYPTLFTSKDISGPLSKFLNRDCTLAKFSDGPTSFDDQSRIPLLFSNESPFLLITSESVNQIHQWIQEEENKQYAQKDKIRLAFRSNFIIAANSSLLSKFPAFYEEKIRRISIGPLEFAVMGPCRRCQMIALDQTTGLPTPEVLTVVARHCRCQQQGNSFKGRLLFGLHLMWLQQWNSTMQDSTIHSGMPVVLHY